MYVLATILSMGIGLFFIWAYHTLFKGEDRHLFAPQASHQLPTPRLGGSAVLLAIFITILISGGKIDVELLLCTIPVFVFGLIEDLGRSTSPRIRLAVAAIATLLGIAVFGIWIDRVDVPVVDFAFIWAPVGIVFTVFAVTGLVHAINLIDGVNGLASGKVILSSGALALIAAKFNEPMIAHLATLVMFATIGLFILNYPLGRIFMGDAGAYSLGFILGWMIIFLMHRQPEISAWAMLAVIFWPVMDTVFAIGRRRFSNGRADKPDRLHFHQLIMRFWEIMSGGKLSKKVANPLATATILPLAALPVAGGVIFVDQPLNSFLIVMVSVGVFWLTYSLAIFVIRRRRLRHFIGRMTLPIYGLFLSSDQRSEPTERATPAE
ncbi:UDP-phosphate N-acetylglucosaminyl 1-phosphate transferase [Rhodobacteraceae bacterium Araon29]